MAAFCRRHVVGKKTRNLCYFVVSLAKLNKAVIDRRLRPRCCHLESYFRRPKSSPVCPLACNWYHCAHFAAKPKAACGLRFSWAATSSNFGFLSKYDVIHKTGNTQRITTPPEEYRATATDNMRKKFGADRTCTSEDIIADRHTHRQTDRHAHRNTPLVYRGRSS